MLKTNSFKQNQVVCFKLASGEEVIAKIKSDDESTFVLTASRTLVAMQNGAGLAPIASMGEADAEIQLRKDSVMFTYLPQKDIEGKYIQEVSNIAVAAQPAKGKIIS
jgi:hypothetical protein